jgi:hypothetical protein
VWLEGQWNLEAGSWRFEHSSSRAPYPLGNWAWPITRFQFRWLAVSHHSAGSHTLDSAVSWRLGELPAGIHFDRDSRQPSGAGFPAFDETHMRRTTVLWH